LFLSALNQFNAISNGSLNVYIWGTRMLPKYVVCYFGILYWLWFLSYTRRRRALTLVAGIAFLRIKNTETNIDSIFLYVLFHTKLFETDFAQNTESCPCG